MGNYTRSPYGKEAILAFFFLVLSIVFLTICRQNAASAVAYNKTPNPPQSTIQNNTQSAAPPVASTPTKEPLFITEGAELIAKVIYGEARGIQSVTEQACIAWTILNRVDAGFGTIREVVTASKQFHYRSHFPTVDDYGRDLIVLAKDVLWRWVRERCGETNVGRVLPSNYLWYYGDGEHNWFRDNFKGNYTIWDYSFASPYYKKMDL